MLNRRQMFSGVACPHCGSDWMPKDGASRAEKPIVAGVAGDSISRVAVTVVAEQSGG